MYPQMTQISPIEAHLRHLRNLWIKIQVIRENALLNQAFAAFQTLRCGFNERFPGLSSMLSSAILHSSIHGRC